MQPPNAVARMLGLLGDEWTLLIIQRALLGATRYGEFAAALPVSNSVLTARLHSLTAEGLLDRREYQINPSRSEYLVTRRSRSLWPMLTSIWEWERLWVPGRSPRLPNMRHRPCGGDFAPRAACKACDAAASGNDVVAQWGPSGSWERSIPATTNRRRSGGRRSGAGLLFPQTMSVSGDRWAFALMVAAFVGMARFTDFQSPLGAPPATIADRLSVFTGEGILVNADGRYELTEKGGAFFPVPVTALQWAQRWYPEAEGPAVVLTHTGCGRRLVPVLVCDQCSTVLRTSFRCSAPNGRVPTSHNAGMTTLQNRPHSALLIVDVQNDVVDGAHRRDTVVASIGALVERARREDVPVVWVQHSDDDLARGSHGWQIVPELSPGEGEALVEKHYGDSFEDTGLERELATRQVGRLVVVGAETDACVRSTLHGAFVRGYDTIFWSATPTPPRTRLSGVHRPSRPSSRTPTSTGRTRPRRGARRGPPPPRSRPETRPMNRSKTFWHSTVESANLAGAQ